mgnify:FL=1
MREEVIKNLYIIKCSPAIKVSIPDYIHSVSNYKKVFCISGRCPPGMTTMKTD